MILGSCEELEFPESSTPLELAGALLRRSGPDIMIIDKVLGMHSVLDWLERFEDAGQGAERNHLGRLFCPRPRRCDCKPVCAAFSAKPLTSIP